MSARGRGEPLTPAAKKVLRVAFLTLFLDLAGFSIIFPLFPAMLEYYSQHEAGGLIFGGVTALLERFSVFAGADAGAGAIILFGGFLGSLYSILQFLCAPIFGSLSDRLGRKPILFTSILGTTLSYALWFFAGPFWLLLLSRFIGGIMSGNISTASAVVADVTTERTRSKGMAIIGMAFGVGFIGGPVMGGMASLVDLSVVFPSLAAYGVNPFSFPALIAFVLGAINVFVVAYGMPETRKPGAEPATVRTINPITLIRLNPTLGVRRTNLTYFLFLTAFSGMEFSLSFLAHERFDYSPRQIAMLLLFTGVILAAMQGSYVQMRGTVIGPRRMALHGLICVIPGFFLIGAAPAPWCVYLGLLFMAVGSAQTIPCLTALASLYAPPDQQGRVLGVFRSLGALARAIGPIVACVLFWRLGSGVAYYLAALSLAAPVALALSLPATPARSGEPVPEATPP